MKRVLSTILICSIYLSSSSQVVADSTLTDSTKIFSLNDLQKIKELLVKIPYEYAQPILFKMQDLLNEKLKNYQPKKPPKK